MARYGISQEGADSLRNLAQELRTINDEIQESGNELISSISGVSDGLGVFEDAIIDMASRVNAVQSKGRGATETLIDRLTKQAGVIDDLISSGLA